MRPVLRPLHDDDVPAVADLEAELFGRSAWSVSMIRGELAAPGRWYVAADDADAPASGLIGYAGLWFDGDMTQVMTVGVAAHAHGRGVGSVLVQALIDRSRELGAGAVLLEVRVDNEAAIAVYRRLGFEVLARRARYYQPEDVDAWTMRLALE